MSELLRLENIHKFFGKYEALRGLDFSVDEGEIISVLGPSAGGKSTLLQIVAGLQSPDEGTVTLQGEVVSSPKFVLPPEKRNINMVFQDFALWPHMNVYDNVAYGLRRQKLPAAGIRGRVSEMLDLLHLTGLEKRLPAQLSGGQQQRVAIARALATKPRILLLDEPLSNLDVQLRTEMRSEMAYLFRKLGTTVFHVTHDPVEAFALADRMIILGTGVIEQIATPMACFQKPATPLVASILGAGNRMHGKAAEGGAPALWIGEEKIAGVLPKHDGQHPAQLEARFRADDVRWSQKGKSEGNTLSVRVIHSAFEGKQYRVLAQTKCGQRISFMHEHLLKPEQEGAVSLSANGVFLYPQRWLGDGGRALLHILNTTDALDFTRPYDASHAVKKQRKKE